VLKIEKKEEEKPKEEKNPWYDPELETIEELEQKDRKKRDNKK